MQWEYWRLGRSSSSGGGRKRAPKGDKDESLQLCCDLATLQVATLHDHCSVFGLGVAASFRLIAQSHLGPCWSWSSATHLLLCACSVLTLVHSPQCHSRSSYRPPEASPPCRCRLSGLSLGSYPWAVSSRLSSTPGWTDERLSHPPVSLFRRAMDSQEIARISHDPAGQGITRAVGGRTRFRMVPPTWFFMCGSQAPAPAGSPERVSDTAATVQQQRTARQQPAPIPVSHTALAMGRIVDLRFPSFQKPGALVVGRPMVLAYDPLHAASLNAHSA